MQTPQIGFRFHTGSIKSKQLPDDIHKLYMFRFHTGSIKSRTPAPEHQRSHHTGFDSILVRLKAI